jgi:hypothetical protein
MRKLANHARHWLGLLAAILAMTRFLFPSPAEPHSVPDLALLNIRAAFNAAAALGVDREASTRNGGLER